MKRIATFIEGNFKGYLDMAEINRLKNEAHDIAVSVMKHEQADHVVYGYFDIDNEGNIVVARLYSGITQDDATFQSVTAMIPNAHIYAIHKH